MTAPEILYCYGHNGGQTPVCGRTWNGYGDHYKGAAQAILPHGVGMQPGMKWCPDCMAILDKMAPSIAMRWLTSLLGSPAHRAAEYGAALGEKMQKQNPCTCGHGKPFHFDRFCSPELLVSMPEHADGACRMPGCGCGAYCAKGVVA